MPCTDGEPDPREIAREREYRDLMARTACEACKVLEAHGLINELTAEQRSWWEHHKRQDAEREARLRRNLQKS